jgi:hypothetical protein
MKDLPQPRAEGSNPRNLSREVCRRKIPIH